ncbi:MAG: peptidylprolyl isomerase [Bacteroidales bacterium]|nr:peptidylprolyl isomerase [Bacteroidales bacterium]MBN2699517.1 peptidylprolyl isomerase [Bacteroidales bacterium]
MRIKTIIVSVLILSGISLTAQENGILLTLGDEEVTLGEFERIYNKNNNENSLNRQKPEEYLQLFINFKLKVLEAESLGMDTTRKFIDELSGYRSQLAKPYLTDTTIRDAMVREAYERSKVDINASHILIKIDPKSPPEDTLIKYNKAMEIRQRIINGEPFEKVARATSEDASVRNNGGNLNYFTVFSMIYPFETAAYNTPVGGVSMPVRTDFGYHIIKVHDRRPARGQVKVAHIFIRLPDGTDETAKTEAWKRASMVYDSLEAGTDFAELAARYSDDPNSARQGGELPWFGTGRMIPEFENACFGIDNIGDYTKPIKTFYGWHIIKLLDRKTIGSFKEMKPELLEKTNRGDRASHKSHLFIEKLKQDYNYTLNDRALSYVVSQLDTSVFEGKWTVPESFGRDMLLFTIGDKQVTTGDFARYIKEQQSRRRAYSLRVYADEMLKEYSESVIMKYEEEQLPEKYPEFRHIVEEYHDGILLFDIMDERVWSKAVKDTAGLEQFHSNHLNDYMWGQRADAVIVSCDSTVNLEKARKAYRKIIKGRWDEEDFNRKFCQNDTLPCITFVTLLVEEGENEHVDKLNMKVGIGNNFRDGENTAFVVVRDIRDPEPRKLNEARGQITSDYQNELEMKWIEELRKKYPVKVNQSLLSRISYKE